MDRERGGGSEWGGGEKGSARRLEEGKDEGRGGERRTGGGRFPFRYLASPP